MENPFEAKKTQRPNFLTVLCVLTFIGSGWGILSSLFSLATAGLTDPQAQMSQYSAILEQAENLENNSFLSDIMSSMMGTLQATAEHAQAINGLSLLLAVISLIGAIFMFRLKRSGFYIYMAAQILMLFVVPAFAGFSPLTIALMCLSGFFAALFIILYGVNLKYMVR